MAQWAGRGEAGAQKWNQIMECLEAGLGGPEGTGKPLKERRVQMCCVRNVTLETVWDQRGNRKQGGCQSRQVVRTARHGGGYGLEID